MLVSLSHMSAKWIKKCNKNSIETTIFFCFLIHQHIFAVARAPQTTITIIHRRRRLYKMAKRFYPM
jgi:hypothetical protein